MILKKLRMLEKSGRIFQQGDSNLLYIVLSKWLYIRYAEVTNS